MHKDKPIEEIIKNIEDKNSFLVVAHENPDGDAIGSMGAIYYILKKLNKDVVLFNKSNIPERFYYLEFVKNINSFLKKTDYDTVIVLDSGELSRTGLAIDNLKYECIINIDHHVTNDYFGDINWVDPKMSSVGEMIAYIAKEINIELKDKLAECIYTSIVSDTGSFTFSNTRPDTLRIVIEILENGFDLDDFNRKYQRYWTLNKVHLHGLSMQNAKLYLDGQLGIISISKDMLERTSTTKEDCEGIINYLRVIKGVKVAATLREDDDRVKVSLRSYGEVDVSNIAKGLNGGGHKNAAGGSIFLPLQQAEKFLVNKVEEFLLENS